jgi:type IV secretory pathway VirB2 component (pilin)
VVAVSLHLPVRSILRAVRHNLGRFLAIFGIVTLGVGFVAGLWATTPDMRYLGGATTSASQNAADIFIKATDGPDSRRPGQSSPPCPAVAQLMPAQG